MSRLGEPITTRKNTSNERCALDETLKRQLYDKMRSDAQKKLEDAGKSTTKSLAAMKGTWWNKYGKMHSEMTKKSGEAERVRLANAALVVFCSAFVKTAKPDEW